MIATAGILLGTIIGVLPGLGGANGVAILLPVTFVMPHTLRHYTAVVHLLGAPVWGRSPRFSSISLVSPGRWPRLDGHPMAKQGLGGQALTAAFMSSFIGAAFAIILVTFLRCLLPSFRCTLVRRSSSACSS